MDEKELFDFALHGGIEAAKVLGMYFGALFASQALLHTPLAGRRITTPRELEEVTSQEAKRLGLDPLVCRPYFSKDATYAEPDGSRHSIVVSKSSARRQNIRHELSHVKHDDGAHGSLLRYLFLEEPRATLYGYLGGLLPNRRANSKMNHLNKSPAHHAGTGHFSHRNQSLTDYASPMSSASPYQ